MKAWNRNNNGQLISAVDVKDMDEAQRLAVEWNKGERRPGMRVDIIANAGKTADATKVRAAY